MAAETAMATAFALRIESNGAWWFTPIGAYRVKAL
jgi:hypothetical protein